MDKSLEVTNIKTETTALTSSDQQEILSEILVENLKQQSDCLIQSEIHIKTEPQENESKFPVISGTSYQLCPNYDIQIETEESLIKIEYEDVVDEILQDPLDVGDEIKVEERCPINLKGEPGIKTEPIDKEKDENISDKHDARSSRSSQDQDLLLIRNDPNRKDKKYVCHFCNKAFRQKDDLVRHLRIHTGVKPFTCTICKKSFTEKSTLNNHMLIHSGKKSHICDVCNKIFRHKSALNDHKLIHSGEKPFSCNICSKLFARKQDLVRHERIHTGEKPYACNICDKAFVKKSDLTTHTRTHTGEKPFSCDVCKKSFTRKLNLNKHKKNHKN